MKCSIVTRKIRFYLWEADIDFFDIIAEVLQGDILASNLFIICLDNELPTSIDLINANVFTLKRQEDDIPPKLLQTQTTQMT